MALRFTKSRSLKSVPSVFLALAVLLIAAGLTFTRFVNIWLADNHETITQILNDRLGDTVRIGPMHYGLSQGIVVDNVRIGGEVHPSLPSSASVKRLRLVPWISIYPKPVVYWKIVLENPSFSLKAGLRDIFYAGRIIAAAPVAGRRIGPVYVEFRLGSVQIKKGRVTLLSPEGQNWRQDFENVQLFAGRNWFGAERMILSGNIAGNLRATFSIKARLKNMAPESLDTVIRFDCRQFATSYLASHLEPNLPLPDEKITAAVKITVKKGRYFSSRGKPALPSFDESFGLLGRMGRFLTPTLRYSITGEILREGVHFSKLELKTGMIALKGAGDLKFSDEEGGVNVTLASKKMSAIKFRPLLGEARIESGDVQFYLNLGGSIRKIRPSLDVVLFDAAVRDVQSGFLFSKINGRANFSPGALVIDNVWLFAGNLPVGVKGWIKNFDAPDFEMKLSTYPGQIPTLKPKNPLNAELEISGKSAPSGENIRAKLEWTEFRGGKQEKKTGEVAFEGLRSDATSLKDVLRELPRGVRASFESLQVSRFRVEKGSASIRTGGRRLEWKLSEGTLARGRLKSDGWAEPGPRGAIWDASASIEGADAAALAAGTFPVTGSLDANARAWNDDGNPRATAHFVLSAGTLGPLPALGALADKTGIEPLRKLDYSEISGSVSKDRGEISLDGLKVVSETARITADLKIRDKRIGGTVSAKFPAKAIDESSKLKWLMKFVGSREGADFDFRVAGTPASPRVEWLSGEFKKKIESRLAPWLRNILSSELEKRVA